MGSLLPSEILAALARGQTILTANQRAARSLRHTYNLHQPSTGVTLWTPPEVYALDTWLHSLHHRLTLEGHESRLLLNRSQEHSLWRDLIAADPAVSGLRSVDSLAEMASNAWHLLHLYNGHGRLREFNVSTDTRAFQRWAEAFDRNCNRHAYLTAAELPAALAFALAEGNLPIPNAGLILVDFDSLAPAHTTLFESIRQAGYPVDSFYITVPATTALANTHDDTAELRAAALWSRDLLAQNPAATIAIVVPNLADRRPQIDRVFSELLPPNSFEFSLGQPLAETAPVAAALDLLRWPLEPLQLPAISNLLLSPFFAATDPQLALAAAEFDAFELRRANLLRPELSLEAMINLVLRAKRADTLPPLLNRLKSLGAPSQSASSIEVGSKQSHAFWADHFRALLDAANWTAATTLDSASFQTHRRWESTLDELSTLDFEGATVTAADALRALTRIARQAIFAPESQQASIQILGPLEPGGIPFDALWFLSADDQSWPAAAVGSPLIPWHIQRDLGIPGADPTRDTALAHALTNRLAQSAATVVFSYAQHDSAGERRPSPLLRALHLSPLDAPAEPAHQPLPFDTFADTQPIPPLPPGVTPGGARILELQAACSFRAFAEIRLHSTEPDTRELGLDARDRGIHVHKIMQTFWDQIRTQKALRALTTPEREAILDECIEIAIERAASAARTPWEDAYLDVQRRRLRALLHPWLDFELTRPAFEVRQQEEKRLVEIGPLTLELRADRIDNTQGGPLILDYKTGSATPSQWLSDRPDAPQLPLYAVLSEDAENLGGVAFALLRAGDDLALKGIGSPTVLDSPTSKNFAATLTDQLEDWHRILTDLAEAFAHHDPIAAPKKYPQTCDRCSQRMLCRLDPNTLNATEEEEEETADV